MKDTQTFLFVCVGVCVCMCAYLLGKESSDACEKFDISQTEQRRSNDSLLSLLSTG